MPRGAPTSERLKELQTKHWNAVAGGWSDWFEWTERSFAPVTDWLREAAGWRAGARVLDIACGAGYPALAAAASIRPGGTVVAIDISPEMVAAASRRATAAGIDNVEFSAMDAEQLRADDHSFDSATNAYGLMFCPAPERAVREIHRVLKPGGAVALVTWAERSKSPFFATAGDVAARFLSLPPPDPAAPGPFRLASPEVLESLLARSGFEQVSAGSLPVTFECESVAEYFQIFSDYAWKSRIASLSDEETVRFREALSKAAQPFVHQDGRLRLVATSICASGVKRA
jgi:enediyne biosynthesis protein CalE5